MPDPGVADLKAMNETLEKRVAERTAEAEARANKLRDLALALADAEARERKRLAHRLHDGFQQLLSAARMKAAIVRRNIKDDSAREGILQVERLVEQAIAESRALTTELSPAVLYDGGLQPAVELLVKTFEKEHQLPVKMQLDPAAEPEAEQVRVLLFEATRELLTNVASHAKASAVELRIGLSTQNHVEVCVSDDGVGLDAGSVEHSKKRDKPFGLLEIRERLEYIGGGMKLTSAPGQGTSVLVHVPSALRSVTEQGSFSRPIDAPRSSGVISSPKGRCQIVVADDHAIFREGLIAMLAQDPDYQVVAEAADGEEAIAQVLKHRPHILIVDVTMPRMNGVEVTARLSREMPDLKIIGLSMHEHDAMASAMRAAGAAAYVTKGGSSEALLAQLRELVCTDRAG